VCPSIGVRPKWSRRFGPAQLLGLDGTDDFSPGGETYRWLNDALPRSDTPFIFVFNHYNACTSGPHLRSGPDGEPV